jgi:hypothetical protein
MDFTVVELFAGVAGFGACHRVDYKKNDRSR